MAFKKQGKDLHSKIEVIKPIEDKKILASQEEKIKIEIKLNNKIDFEITE